MNLAAHSVSSVGSVRSCFNSSSTPPEVGWGFCWVQVSEVGDFIECVVVELRGFRAADLNVSTVEF